ncbi:DUF5677 domain-containing protein [Methylobacterium sp. J-059]|uniref:DUF5677 domain-containing protein n=1 Tax=Methylobacterium sp. J-059 TaxID=2836643 RepID=UPI001FB9F097|nr:DUF5677 domain-containing protein [Methylobacterium sp. J-059]MCJ2042244.1 DUF5677 domain-containing protein [Methylobacterium sp. J-059]
MLYSANIFARFCSGKLLPLADWGAAAVDKAMLENDQGPLWEPPKAEKPELSLPERIALVRELLAALDIVMGDISRTHFTGGLKEQSYDIVRRAAIIRQREGLTAILSLCDTGSAAFGVCLLRPAYEEMLWLEYLSKHSDVANELLHLMGQASIKEHMRVQMDYLKRDGMHAVGFTMKFAKLFIASAPAATAGIKAIGAKLGWRRESDKPSVAHIAQQVGRKDEYDYIYEATSRFVHFSPHELMRRAWGDHETMHISSDHFAKYWALFSLHWGLRIFLNSIRAVHDIFPDDSAKRESYDKITEIIQSGILPPVPIITEAELDWSYMKRKT